MLRIKILNVNEEYVTFWHRKALFRFTFFFLALVYSIRSKFVIYFTHIIVTYMRQGHRQV